MPDHLIVGDQFIYGSTVNSERANAADNIFVWRANVIGGLLSETEGDLVAIQLHSTTSTGQITGLRKSHDDDNFVHGMLYYPDSYDLYYVLIDLGSP